MSTTTNDEGGRVIPPSVERIDAILNDQSGSWGSVWHAILSECRVAPAPATAEPASGQREHDPVKGEANPSGESHDKPVHLSPSPAPRDASPTPTKSVACRRCKGSGYSDANQKDIVCEDCGGSGYASPPPAPPAPQAHDDPMQCECATWAGNLYDRLLGNGHHQNCPRHRPYIRAIELVGKLVKGIDTWAAEEDGVPDFLWDAYAAAHLIAKGCTPAEQREEVAPPPAPQPAQGETYGQREAHNLFGINRADGDLFVWFAFPGGRVYWKLRQTVKAEDHYRIETGIAAALDAARADGERAGMERAAKVAEAQASEPECPERAQYIADAIRAAAGATGEGEGG